MIHLMVRPLDGSLMQRYAPCPVMVRFRTWAHAARACRDNYPISDLGVIMVEFTGKHAKEARTHGQVAQV